jgi:hypothetical protein
MLRYGPLSFYVHCPPAGQYGLDEHGRPVGVFGSCRLWHTDGLLSCMACMAAVQPGLDVREVYHRYAVCILSLQRDVYGTHLTFVCLGMPVDWSAGHSLTLALRAVLFAPFAAVEECLAVMDRGRRAVRLWMLFQAGGRAVWMG